VRGSGFDAVIFFSSSARARRAYPANSIATATYTAPSQLNTLAYGVYAASFYESRSYDTLMQLTNLTVGGQAGAAVNMQYSYMAGYNNGQVSQTTDGVLGETVNYGYDMWNRLTNATATNGSWGEAYAFDGFGNLTGKTPTAASASALNLSINAATNQPIGLGSYDANGNTQGNSNSPGVPAYVWDIENRRVTTPMIGHGVQVGVHKITGCDTNPFSVANALNLGSPCTGGN
jgi:hypothetical protein